MRRRGIARQFAYQIGSCDNREVSSRAALVGEETTMSKIDLNEVFTAFN
jgi:hypothetical protein